jgi:hypothetical protein
MIHYAAAGRWGRLADVLRTVGDAQESRYRSHAMDAVVDAELPDEL